MRAHENVLNLVTKTLESKCSKSCVRAQDPLRQCFGTPVLLVKYNIERPEEASKHRIYPWK